MSVKCGLNYVIALETSLSITEVGPAGFSEQCFEQIGILESCSIKAAHHTFLSTQVLLPQAGKFGHYLGGFLTKQCSRVLGRPCFRRARVIT